LQEEDFVVVVVVVVIIILESSSSESLLHSVAVLFLPIHAEKHLSFSTGCSSS
jgi:hypothetical protein